MEQGRAVSSPSASSDDILDLLERADEALWPFTSEAGPQIFKVALHAPLLRTEDVRSRLKEGRLMLDGWTHTDEAVIEAQGALTRIWTTKALPKLKFQLGLVACLERRGAGLLGVGAGAATRTA